MTPEEKAEERQRAVNEAATSLCRSISRITDEGFRVHVTVDYDSLPGADVRAVAQRKPKTHELKTLPAFFQPSYDGRKQMEVRKNDRDFRAGDYLDLREWLPDDGYTGRFLSRRVEYVLENFEGLRPGWVAMSTSPARSTSPRTNADWEARGGVIPK